MTIRVKAIPRDGMQILISDFARRFVEAGNSKGNEAWMARSISVTLRQHGCLNAYVSADEFSRACAEARGEKP
ncbi:hypothetical protein CIC12_02530 [Burkholderia sp. SG-MS1]|uniref:hypothetical protein n=1 Tax=Paraburkholderia sp. SG-MS1 TaxID=2023741 RepID=UPI0014460058|nr:hypothetical protein [Paraburkholderia sp. SG-MS1]NKJ45639.1 hypothetical protein [Paraburkholderia sp. SG-MS1]